MFNIKTTRILMIITSIMIIMGIFLMYQTMQASEDPNVTTVNIKNGSTETLEFTDLSLIPGSSSQYDIKLKGNGMTQTCEVVLDFVKKGGKGLEDVAYVKILFEDEVLYEELLATAFETEGITFSVDFSKNKNTDLQIIYYLPETAGNEIKNAEAVFELQISASNE